jgi:hypothetical protein
MPFQLAAARLGIFAFGLGLVAAAFAVATVRLDVLRYAVGYQVMIAATLLGLVALGAALAWLLSAFRRNRGEGRAMGLIALFGALLLLYPPLSAFKHRLTSPSLYDITTDTEHPPAFVALRGMRGAGANSPDYDGAPQISYQGEMRSIDYVLHMEYPEITKPHAGFFPRTQHPVGARFWQAFETAKAMGWTIVSYSEAQGRIEATDASFWFGRVADIVIRVSQAGASSANGVRVDIRVQSRDDRRDDGTGALRITRFLRRLPACTGPGGAISRFPGPKAALSGAEEPFGKSIL